MAMLTVIGAAVLSVATPAHRPGGLPLMRGVYVDVGAPCTGEPSSMHSWYGGSGYVIQAPHAHCVAKRVRRHGKSTFEVQETCRDESMPNSDYSVTDRIHVIDQTEYVIRNKFGRFHARWCRE